MTQHLPEMPVWHARSFYAALLTAATVICNVIGIDFLAFLAGLGFGATEADILDTVEKIMPAVFMAWMYVERMSPRFKLVWRRARQIDVPFIDL